MYMNINIKYILISVVAGANYNLYDVWDTEPELELVTCAARAPPSLPPPPHLLRSGRSFSRSKSQQPVVRVSYNIIIIL